MWVGVSHREALLASMLNRHIFGLQRRGSLGSGSSFTKKLSVLSLMAILLISFIPGAAQQLPLSATNSGSSTSGASGPTAQTASPSLGGLSTPNQLGPLPLLAQPAQGDGNSESLGTLSKTTPNLTHIGYQALPISACAVSAPCDWGGNSPYQTSAVALSSDGSQYAVGDVLDSNGNPASALILKYNSNGAVAWAESWGEGSPTGALAVAVASGGGTIYIVGYTSPSQSSNDLQAYVLSLSSAGVANWVVTFGAEFQSVAFGVAVSQVDGSVYVVGTTTSHILANHDSDAFIAKLTPSGTLSWQQTWEGNLVNQTIEPQVSDLFTAVAVSSDGNSIYATGISFDEGTSCPSEPCYFTFPILAKWNPAGNQIWQYVIVPPGGDGFYNYVATSITIGSAGTLFMAGFRYQQIAGGVSVNLMDEDGFIDDYTDQLGALPSRITFIFNFPIEGFLAEITDSGTSANLDWAALFISTYAVDALQILAVAASPSDDSVYVGGLIQTSSDCLDGLGPCTFAGFLAKVEQDGTLDTATQWSVANGNTAIDSIAFSSANPGISIGAVASGDSGSVFTPLSIIYGEFGTSFDGESPLALALGTLTDGGVVYGTATTSDLPMTNSPLACPSASEPCPQVATGGAGLSGPSDSQLIDEGLPVDVQVQVDSDQGGSATVPSLAFGGTSTAPPSATGLFFPGTSLSLSASPGRGTCSPSTSVNCFVDWSSLPQGSASFSSSTSAQTTALIPSSATASLTITANFGTYVEFLVVNNGLPNDGQWSVILDGSTITGVYTAGTPYVYFPNVPYGTNNFIIPTIYQCSPGGSGCSYVPSMNGVVVTGLQPLTVTTAIVESIAFTYYDGVTVALTLTPSVGSTPYATFGISGCNSNPATIVGNGIPQTITAAQDCPITISYSNPSLPQSEQYIFAGGATEVPVNTCAATPSTTLTCSPVGITYYYQLQVAFSYAIVGSGAPTAPTLTFLSQGQTVSVTLSQSAVAYFADFGTTWSTTNPLTNGASERWESANSQGQVSSPSTVVVSYQNQYDVTIQVASGEASFGAIVTNSGSSGWMNSGQQVTVTASPNPGYKFTGWTESAAIGISCTSGSGCLQSQTITVTASTGATLTASFAASVALSLSPGSGAAVAGSSVSVIATVNGAPQSSTLSLAGLPVGATATWYSSTVTDSIAGVSDALIVSTSVSTPPETYPLTVTVTGANGQVASSTYQLTVSSATFPRMALLQSCANTEVPVGTTQATITCTLPNAVAAGDLIVVEVGDLSPVLTDTQGNSYTNVANVFLVGGSNYDVAVFYTFALSSGPDTITLTGQGSFPAIIAHELSGVGSISAYSTGSGSSLAPSVASYSPLATGSFVIGTVLYSGGQLSASAGSGYTLLSQNFDPMADEYIASSSGVTTSPFSLSASQAWAEISVALSPSVAVNPTVTLSLQETGEPIATFTLSGCSVNPTTLIGNGNSYVITANDNCRVTITAPPATANGRYVFGPAGGGSATITTCMSGGCPAQTVDYYYQMLNTYVSTPVAAITWDAGPLSLDGSATATSCASTCSMTLSTSNTNDIIIIALLSNAGSGSITSVTDSAGLTWHARYACAGADRDVCEEWAYSAGTLSSDVIKVTYTSPTGDLVAFGVSGANTAAPFDANTNLSNEAAGPSCSESTSNANDMLITMAANGGNPTFTLPAGFTKLAAIGSGFDVALGYEIVSSVQSGAKETWSWTSTAAGEVLCDAIQAASPIILTGTSLGASGQTICMIGAPAVGTSTAVSCSGWVDYDAGLTMGFLTVSSNERWAPFTSTYTETSGGNTLTDNYYEQLQNTYQATPSSPATWDEAYSMPVSGTLLGSASTLCIIATTSGGGPASCTGWGDYDKAVSFPSTVSGWSAQGTTSFTDTTGGNVHDVNYVLSAAATPSIVQTCSNAGVPPLQQEPSFTCALTSAVTQGDMIIVEISDVAPAVTDSQGNTYTLLTSVPVPTSTYDLYVYYTFAKSGGSDSVYVVGQGNYPGVLIHEIKGATNIGAFSAGSGTSATPAVAAYTPPSGSLVIAASQESAYLSWSAGPGYSLLSQAGTGIADETAQAAGSTTSQFSLSGSAPWCEISFAIIS
jgi:hypothetical protein